MKTKEESPVLVLPRNPAVVARLSRELEALEEGIRRYNQEYPAQHPCFRERVQALQVCKIAILKPLLSGRAVAWDISKTIMEERMEKDAGSMQAFAVAWVNAWNAVTAVAVAPQA